VTDFRLASNFFLDYESDMTVTPEKEFEIEICAAFKKIAMN